MLYFVTGSVMVTLFWYYRPEEAIGIQPTDFQEVYNIVEPLYKSTPELKTPL